MAHRQITITDLKSRRAGINFVCSDCGASLYHIGVDGVEDAGGNKADRSAYSLQPPMSEILRSCPKCGRKLNFEIDPNQIRIHAREELTS